MGWPNGYGKAAKALSLHDTLLRSWLDRLAPDWRTQRGGLMEDSESQDPSAMIDHMQPFGQPIPFFSDGRRHCWS